ncbi:MAG TPA: deoxyribose-phosphate aldolase [Bacillota bacterium]|nr:deoxyribose-phosphate aldolase [Bacillota bacterium]
MTESLASYIDHTALKAETTKEQIDQLVTEAKEYNFASVCVNPTWVSYCSEQLQGSSVKVCTVIGFPLGANATATKVFETKQAIQDGATEVDMVINIGALKDGNHELVLEDICAVVEAAKGKALTKVIIETALLSEDEKKQVSALVKESGADYIKTSTGFSTNGATEDDVRLMRSIVGASIGVKASGGIRDLNSMKLMIDAGATRIGASAGVAIMQELEK